MTGWDNDRGEGLGGMLNIAHICSSTYSLGPGERAVVWVQGCHFKCPGCLAPEWQPFQPAQLMSPSAVLTELLSSPTVTGLTFSGGEPMLQAEQLSVVAQMAHEQRNLDIICFTGYQYETLLFHPPAKGISKLLAQIDVLIDGIFILARFTGIGLRGSDNQRIIHLTERLKKYNFETCPRQVEVKIRNGEMELIGIPQPAIELALRKVVSQFSPHPTGF